MDVGTVPGVPSWFRDRLRAAGIEDLYPPQAEAVEAGVTDGRNLVASVPTASGKTLIAELAMVSALTRAGQDAGTRTSEDPATGPGADSDPPSEGPDPRTSGTALYIVPLRALASEKRAEFERLERDGLQVGVSTGNYESDGRELAGADVVVATSEKVDSLVRNDAPWLEDLACVVADEVHLVDDAERGPTLEVTLAKLRRINPEVQTIALSATIGNAGELADWLDAALVDSTWRPIELRKGVHYGQALHLEDGSQRELRVESGENQTAGIVRDTLADDGSTLVFVNSRRNAEAAARRLSNTVEPTLEPDDRERLATVADEIRAVSDTETSEDLATAVESGAAFHHAGLASAHRSLIEDAFRERLVRVVCATPTLAAGVNTPSRRVVVRDWRRYDGTAGGMQPLSVLEVHQMMGRAGRPGLDPYGEAVLLAGSHDELDELFERYVWADPEPVRSKLAAEPALRTHILATVASGFARSRAELLAFLENTLYATQTTEGGRLESVVDEVIAYLRANDFLEVRGDPGLVAAGESEDAHDGRESDEAVDGPDSDEASAGDEPGEAAVELAATGLGHTVSRLYLDPMSAAEIVDGLRAWQRTGGRARPADRDGPVPADGAGAGPAEGDGAEPADAEEAEPAAFTTASELVGEDEDPPDPTALGLYHLVARTPDMYQLYLRSGDHDTYAQVAYDREEEFLGAMPSEYEEGRFEDWLAALKTAKLLEDWADEVDEERITERYDVGPGDVRGKVETASWLLGAAASLAAELDLPTAALRRARTRVEDGVRAELLDLTEVRGVGRKRARRLFAAGIETRSDLREADKSLVLGAVRGREGTAETILEHAGHRDPSMAGVDPADPPDGAGNAGGASTGGAGDGEDPAEGTAGSATADGAPGEATEEGAQVEDTEDGATEDQASLEDF